MSLLNRVKSIGVEFTAPSTTRVQKDSEHGKVEITPTLGCIRINTTLAQYMQVNYDHVLASTDSKEKPSTHEGVFMSVLHIDSLDIDVIAIMALDAAEAKFKLASPTNTAGSNLQFSSNDVWKKYGGKAGQATIYTMKVEDAIVEFSEDGNPIRLGEMVDAGYATIKSFKDGSVQSITWNDTNPYGFAAGTKVDTWFQLVNPREEIREARTEATETKKANAVKKAGLGKNPVTADTTAGEFMDQL